MRLRQLFEAPGETVGLIFGRFNPPHKGHRAAWEMASKETHWYVGTNMATIGPKDPLPFQVKIKAMETIWPEVSDHIIASQSWLTLASELYTKHPNATLVLFTDEQWVPKTITQYNGAEGPHGSYNFKSIETKPTPRLSSATALRKAVLDNNPEEFADAAGVPADTIIDIPGENITFFDMVAKYLEPHKEKLLAKEDGKGRTTRMPAMTVQPHMTGLSDPDGDYDDGELRVYTQAYRDMYKKAKAAQAKADATGGPGASYQSKPRDITWSSNVFPKLKNPKKPRT